MKEQIKTQKGFIQIPLLAVVTIVVIFVASIATSAFLYKEQKTSALTIAISDTIYRAFYEKEVETEKLKQELEFSKLKEEQVKRKIQEKEAKEEYEQAIEQLQEQIAALKERKNDDSQDEIQQLQQQMINLQQGVIQLRQEKSEELTLSQSRSPQLDINQLTPLVAQVECSKSFGSGFFINSDGWIITNHHVVKKPMYELNGQIYRWQVAGEVIPGCVVSFADNSETPPNIYYWATIPGSYDDPENDLAVLYINSEFKAMNDLRPLDVSERNFPSIPKCFESDFNIGDGIMALGYPGAGGSTITATEGILSGSLPNFYKISAKLNPGSSGGPIILNDEKKGCYIGVASWASLEGIEPQPYAIKAEYVPF